MVDYAAIQAKINYGLGKAGSAAGVPHQWFRPNGSASPLRPACDMGTTVRVVVNTTSTGKSLNAPQPGKPLVYGIFDRTMTLSGDYLVADGGTLFVASAPALLATLLVQCNAVASIGRPDKPGGLVEGLNPGYSADTAATEDAVLTGWPCAITIKTRGETGRVDLPGDVKMAVFEVLLPVCAPVIRTSDVLTDAAGQRYIVGAAELSDTGWRLLGQLENA